MKKLIHNIFLIFVFYLSTVNVGLSQQLAEGQDKFLGAGSSSYIYRNFYEYFNEITPGNEGKWESVESVQGVYNWTGLDKIYNYSVGAKILFKEHTLIWGNQQPSWIGSLDSAGQRQAIERWIKNLGLRYPKMKYADVVNEPLHAAPIYKDALGGDGNSGWDWVITSFELARQYMPDSAILILNDYNILGSTSETDKYLEIINLLKDRGLIDGIGIQGHYFEFRSHLNASNTYVYSINTIKSNLNKVAETGIPIYITEFDIDESDDNNQLEQYKIYFPIFWEHPSVKGITLWGYIQNDIWTSHPDTYLLLSDGTERPAMKWLRSYILTPLKPEIISPNDSIGVQCNPTLTWKSSKSATSYNVQVSSTSRFSSFVVDSTVTDTLMQLDSLDANVKYYWRVSSSNNEGTSSFSDIANFTTGDQIVSIKENKIFPAGYVLEQNYPNPFNPSTTISFYIPQSSHVKLDLMNVLGKVVLDITEGNYKAGSHSVTLNASNLSSGIYFYRIQSGNFISIKKLVVLK